MTTSKDDDQLNNEHISYNWKHVVAIVFGLSFGAILMFFFIPYVGTGEYYHLKYKDDCCYKIPYSSEIRCNYDLTCSSLLHLWTKYSKNLTLYKNQTLLNTCCYYLTNFSTYRILGAYYCNLKCIELNL